MSSWPKVTPPMCLSSSLQEAPCLIPLGRDPGSLPGLAASSPLLPELQEGLCCPRSIPNKCLLNSSLHTTMPGGRCVLSPPGPL